MVNNCKPFLKWAGSKYKIINTIKENLPTGSRLIEPFFGTCSVALNTDFDDYILADTNQDIITLYKILIQDTENFIQYTKTFFTAENNTEDKYYAFRERFNETQSAQEKSALFIYLNRHAFNGLCRYNKKGGFNVPFGRYKSPYFPQQEMLNFAEKLKNATFLHQNFTDTMTMAKKGDVVYCDPPYFPLSETSSFTAYTKTAFTETHQIQLAEFAECLQEKDVKVFISNHNTPASMELYKKSRMITFDVRRFISAKTSGRGNVSEVLACYE